MPKAKSVRNMALLMVADMIKIIRTRDDLACVEILWMAVKLPPSRICLKSGLIFMTIDPAGKMNSRIGRIIFGTISFGGSRAQ